MPSFLTVKDVIKTVGCPTCGVAIDKPCLDPNGKERKKTHNDRFVQARNTLSIKSPHTFH